MIMKQWRYWNHARSQKYVNYPGKDKVKKIEEILEEWACHPSSIKVSELSGGNFAGSESLFARAIFKETQPALFSLDEPTSSLDPENRDFLNFLLDMNKEGKTIKHYRYHDAYMWLSNAIGLLNWKYRNLIKNLYLKIPFKFILKHFHLSYFWWM